MEFSTRFPYSEMKLSASFPRYFCVISAISAIYVMKKSLFKCRKTHFKTAEIAEIVKIVLKICGKLHFRIRKSSKTFKFVSADKSNQNIQELPFLLKCSDLSERKKLISDLIFVVKYSVLINLINLHQNSAVYPPFLSPT